MEGLLICSGMNVRRIYSGMKAMTDSLNMRFHILMEALLLTKYFIRPSNIPNMNNAAVWNRRPFSTCQMLLYNCPFHILLFSTSKNVP